MSKAARIIKLKARGWSNARIAKHIECSTGYVRAALARHKNGGQSPADLKYKPRKRVLDGQRRKLRMATDPEFRRKRLDWQANYRRERYATDTEFAERVRGHRKAHRIRKAEQQQARSA